MVIHYWMSTGWGKNTRAFALVKRSALSLGVDRRAIITMWDLTLLSVHFVHGWACVLTHVHLQALFLRHAVIRDCKWTSVMQVLVWVVVQNLVGVLHIIITFMTIIIASDIFLAGLFWGLHQNLVIFLTHLPVSCSVTKNQSATTVLCRHYCATIMVCSGIIISLFIDDIVGVDGWIWLERSCVVGRGCLSHSWRLLDNALISVLISWERLISFLISGCCNDWPSNSADSILGNGWIFLVKTLFVDLLKMLRVVALDIVVVTHWNTAYLAVSLDQRL